MGEVVFTVSFPSQRPGVFLLPKSGGGKKTCACQIQAAGFQLILLFTTHTAKRLLVFGRELGFMCSMQDRAACLFSAEDFCCLIIMLSMICSDAFYFHVKIL